MIRLVFALASFVYPEWVTLYVFYWCPRHQYLTHLDVPDMTFDDDEGDLAYQHLLDVPPELHIPSSCYKY